MNPIRAAFNPARWRLGSGFADCDETTTNESKFVTL